MKKNIVHFIVKGVGENLEEESVRNGAFSLEMMNIGFENRLSNLSDRRNDTEWVEKKILLENMMECIRNLTPDEQELNQEIYFKELTEREYARAKGVYHNVIRKKKVRIIHMLREQLREWI